MEKNTKRKSINLFLIIFILLFISILILFVVNIIANKKQETSKLSQNNEENNSAVQFTVDSNNTEDTSDFDDISSINSVNTNELPTNESTVQNTNNSNTQNEKTLSLNHHSYVFDQSTQASLIKNNNVETLQILYPDFQYKILYNTDNSINYENLRNQSNLKSYLEDNYNFQITSNLKTGTINNMNMIIFTFSDNMGIGYCIFTSLNDSEIAYSKIYNTDNNKELISDLSNPITKLSLIISSMKN